MVNRPLVSIITPTWGRHSLVVEAVANVRAQTYPNLEHVVVSDGPDHELRRRLWAAGMRPRDSFNDGGRTSLHLVELGYNTSSFFPDSYCAGPNTVGMLTAKGEYQSWLADDERMHPTYIERMVAALERTNADFAYPRVAYYKWDSPSWVVGIGADPPQCGSITTLVYRRELLRKGLYRWHDERESDWSTIKRWIDAGAKWAFVDEVLFTHRDDKGCPPERYADPLPAVATSVVT